MPKQFARTANRLKARAEGATVYDPGFPCKRGHVSLRYVSSDGCLTCLGRGIRGMMGGKVAPYTFVLDLPELAPTDYPALQAYFKTCAQAFIEARRQPDPDLDPNEAARRAEDERIEADMRAAGLV